jgi:hypothetical protein
LPKINKPASLTSSLLARKGEAEPAETRPKLNPENPTAVAAQAGSESGNSNVDGADRGGASGTGKNKDLFGLGNFPLPELTEKSLRSTELEQAETPAAAAPADPVAPAPASPDAAPPLQGVSPAMERAEPRVGPADEGIPDPEILDVEQETVRDARLLKFVYVMAALTGILAIVIYSGGWFIDDGAQKTAKQETPWTPPAQTAATSDAAVPSDRPADASPATPAAEDQPAASMAAAPEKPAEQPVGTDTAPAKSMAAATPDLPASSRVMKEGPASASKSATAESESALPAATPSFGTAEAGGTATGQTPSDQATGAPVDGSAAMLADRQPSADKTASPSMASTAPSGTGAETPGRSDMAVMTDKVPSGESATAMTAPSGTPSEKADAVPAEKSPTEAASAVAASPEQAKAPTPAENAPVAPVATVTPSAAPAPLAKPKGRFLIQLSSVKSQERADREWARLKKSFPKELGNLELIIEKRTIAARGTFFRVQTGRFGTISEARAICAVLAAKKQGCLPIKR